MEDSSKNILLNIIGVIHILVWFIVLYTSLYHPEFNILYVLPIWYLTYVIYNT